MRIKDIIAAIEKTAPLDCQAKWDHSGVQVAVRRSEASQIAVCLDPTPKAIKLAVAQGAEFILSHHPLGLKPEFPDRLNVRHEVLRLLLCSEIPLYAAHTSLDSNLAGPAGWFGRELGLIDTIPLERLPNHPAKGFGEIGLLKEPASPGEFVRRVLQLANLEQLVHCGRELPRRISKVAWCGGSGASMLEEAENSLADVFITGDIRHHTAVEANIPVLDVGHHSLEEEMMARFAAILKEELPIPVVFIPSHSPFKIMNPENA